MICEVNTHITHILQPKGSVHFMCALGNQKWFECLGFDKEHVTELDWWDTCDVTVTFQTVTSKSKLTVTCLPCQHFSKLQHTSLHHCILKCLCY